MSRTAPDLVIIGAGAAGLAAARAARERGLTAVLLEAADRIGGRAWTDSSIFGVPWDLGCHWLHSADVNPMRELADAYGLAYQRDPPEWREYRNGQQLESGEQQRISEDAGRIYESMLDAGRRGEDRPATEFYGLGDPGADAFALSVRAEWGFDPEQISSLDASRYRDTHANWPLKGGYGALIAHHYRGEPVELSIPVSRVEWGGPTIRVHTPQGVLEPSAVLVTVSTGVLGAGAISFDPPLPDWKLAAIDAVPLGRDNKAAIQFRGGVPGVDGSFSAAMPLGDGLVSIQVHPFGTDLVGAFIGGSLATELEALDDGDAVAAVVDALAAFFGSEFKARVVRGAITAWGRDPNVLGAYGAARPGRAHLREQLVTPVDRRLYFAGEATSPDFFSTCHGAHISGIAAIDAIHQANLTLR